jgi:hypothetical protein
VNSYIRARARETMEKAFPDLPENAIDLMIYLFFEKPEADRSTEHLAKLFGEAAVALCVVEGLIEKRTPPDPP